MLNNRMTSTTRVEPRYVLVDDDRVFWVEIRKAIGIAETAVNRRAQVLASGEAAFWGKCLGAVRAALSAKLGLE